MRVTEAQPLRPRIIAKAAPVYGPEWTCGLSVESDGGSAAVAGGVSVIRDWEFDKIHKFR
jgi:hypothetical protein